MTLAKPAAPKRLLTPRRKRMQVYPQGIRSRIPVRVYPDSGDNERFTITADNLVGFGKFEPITVMLAGRRGHGKTSVMTAIGQLFSWAYAQHGVKVNIAANYNTDIATPGFASPDILYDIMEYPEWADDMLVLIDEVATAFPRRRSTARINLDFSTFMQQIRKRNTELIFTTQFPGMLDDQLLINIDLYCQVNMWPKGGTAPFTNVTIAIWDWHGQWNGKFSRPRIPPDGPPSNMITFYNVHKIFGHYNTNEVIAPMWSRAAQRDKIARQSWTEEEREAETAAVVPQAAATDLRSHLLTLPAAFNVAREVEGAQKFDESIKNQKDLVEAIEATGDWTIDTNGSQKFARRKV